MSDAQLAVLVHALRIHAEIVAECAIKIYYATSETGDNPPEVSGQLSIFAEMEAEMLRAVRSGGVYSAKAGAP